MKKRLTPQEQVEKRKIRQSKRAEVRVPFIEHFYELRNRLIYIVASVLLFSTLAYFVQQRLVNFLLRPAHHQQFIYTSPVGGINFLFEICTYVGVILSIPLIIYQVLKFLEPVINDGTRRHIIRSSIFSIILGIIGFCFGYYIGLPSALHFLGDQFTSKQIHSLFTIQEYMTFVTIYLLGSALLFQIPLIMLFINRIKPLKPKKMLGFERYVIVIAFIVALIMAPTPNILDQLLIAGPVILIYQVGIGLVVYANRRYARKYPKKVMELLEQDRIKQAGRIDRHRSPQPVSIQVSIQ